MKYQLEIIIPVYYDISLLVEQPTHIVLLWHIRILSILLIICYSYIISMFLV